MPRVLVRGGNSYPADGLVAFVESPRALLPLDPVSYVSDESSYHSPWGSVDSTPRCDNSPWIYLGPFRQRPYYRPGCRTVVGRKN